jgi:hypothetical protein
MRTETLHPGLAGTAAAAGTGKRVRAALKRLGARIIAAQERRARHLAGPYLARHDDETLIAAGYTAAQIAALRRTYG